MENKIKKYSISLMVSAFSTAIATGILPILLSEVINTFGITGIKEGLMSSTVCIGSLVALFLIIFLQKKFNKEYIIIFLGILTAVMLLIQGMAKNYYLFLCLCFIMGFGNGGVDTCQSSFLTDLNPKTTLKKMGILHAIFGLACIVNPIIFSKLLRNYSWRTIYFIASIMCFIFILQFAISTYLNKDVVANLSPRKGLSNGIDLLFFKSKYSVAIAIFIFFGAAAQSGVITWVIRYVTLALGQKQTATFCLSLYWVFATISRLFSPRIPLKPYEIICLGALISAVAWAVSIATNIPVMICIASAIVGLTSGSCIPMCLSEGANNNRRNTGFATSFLMTVKTIGQILSPIIISYLMNTFSMKTGLYVTSVFFLIDAVLWILLRKYYEEKN